MTPAQRTVYQYLSDRPDLVNAEVWYSGHTAPLPLEDFFTACAELRDAGLIKWQRLSKVRYTFSI